MFLGQENLKIKLRLPVSAFAFLCSVRHARAQLAGVSTMLYPALRSQPLGCWVAKARGPSGHPVDAAQRPLVLVLSLFAQTLSAGLRLGAQLGFIYFAYLQFGLEVLSAFNFACHDCATLLPLSGHALRARPEGECEQE